MSCQKLLQQMIGVTNVNAYPSADDWFARRSPDWT